MSGSDFLFFIGLPALFCAAVYLLDLGLIRLDERLRAENEAA